MTFRSHSWALLYKRTPTITVTVPSPLNNVTGLLNRMTDNQMRNALLAVFATLKRNGNVNQKINNDWAVKEVVNWSTYVWLD